MGHDLGCALFDDGGMYDVEILQQGITWGNVLLHFGDIPDKDAVCVSLSRRAGLPSDAENSSWAAVRYTHHGNYEWIPELWISSKTGPGVAFAAYSSWHCLWESRLHDFHRAHFTTELSQAQSQAVEPREQQKVQQLPLQQLRQNVRRKPSGVSPKYWVQRRSMWRRWDHGIAMDSVAWFSVTPEQAAQAVADALGPMQWPRSDTLATDLLCDGPHTAVQGIIVDAFAGVGGNSIQFALRCGALHGGPSAFPRGLIAAVEIDSTRLTHLEHNAKIYGLQTALSKSSGSCPVDVPLACLQGDSMALLADKGCLLKRAVQDRWKAPEVFIGAVFLAPPWGGELYASSQPRLGDISVPTQAGGTLDGGAIFWRAAQAADVVMYYLPRQLPLEDVLADLVRHPAACRQLPARCSTTPCTSAAEAATGCTVSEEAGAPGTLEYVHVKNGTGKTIAALLTVRWGRDA
jgi:trimethylguanosine synthase